ncbi:MAG: hypothetical protein ABSG75_09165 [Syntrophales bacterium]|jgi:hypothetical protein
MASRSVEATSEDAVDADGKLAAVELPEDPVDCEAESGDVAVVSRGVDDNVSPSRTSASWGLDASKLVFVTAFNVSEVSRRLVKS